MKWLVLVGFCSFSLGAVEFGGLMGRVVDKSTRKPIFCANVVLRGTHTGCATDYKGYYSIRGIRPGIYRVVVSCIGYKTVEKKIEVRAGEVDTVDFELVSSAIQLDAVVVTATRTPRYIKDVPLRTEVITHKAIEDKGACNLYEALMGSPGIRVETQCSYCEFTMVRLQGLGADHTQVLIDGQPIYSGLASVYGLEQMPTVDIDQIEIVKGAGSALYGSNAIAGAINIITKRPSSEPKASLSLEFGSYNTNKYSLMASMSKNNVGLVLTAQKHTGDAVDRTGDGFKKGPDGISDRVKMRNEMIGFRLEGKELLKGDEFTISARTLSELRQGGELANYENPFTEGTERIITERYEGEISYVKRFGFKNSINLSIASAIHHRNATNDAFLCDYMATHNGELPPIDELYPYLACEKLLTGDLHYSQEIFSSHRLLFGVQYSFDKLNESGKYVIVDEADTNYGLVYTSESEKHAHGLGVYLQGEFSLSQVFEIVAGVRYDIHRSQDNFGGSSKVAPIERVELEYKEEVSNPRVALRYNLTPSLTLRTSVGTGFRVPYGFSEDLHLCSGSPRVNKPAGLRPERSVSYNFSVDYSGTRFSWSLNLFRTDLKDKIGFVDASPESKRLGYTYEWRNIDDAFTQGVESSCRMLILSNLVLDINFTYTDAQYLHERADWVEHHPEYARLSKYIPRVPKTTFGAKFEWNPTNWNAVVEANYQGKMYIDYCQDEDVSQPGSKIVETPTYWILNARLNRHLNKWLRVYLGAKNLLDYVQPERHTDDAAFIYAPLIGRIVYGGLEVNF